MSCDCQFDPFLDTEGNLRHEGWHYKRVCENCNQVWWSLSCKHDGYQWPCANCGYISKGRDSE